MLGRTDRELPGVLERNGEKFQDLISSDTGVGQTSEKILIAEEARMTAAGEQRWFRTEKIPMDDSGYPDCLLEITVEVTEEVRIRKKLEEQLQFQQILLEAVPIPIFYQDHMNIYRGCNRAFVELTGVGKDELVGSSVDEIWPGDQASEYMRQNEMIYSQRVRQAESRREKMPDGRVRDLLVVKTIYPDREGRPAGIIGAALDLTEQKQIQTALQVSETRYRRILEGSVLGIFTADTNGEIKEINPALAEMFGYDDRKEALEEIGNIAGTILSPSTEVLQTLQDKLLSGEPAVFDGLYSRRDDSHFSGRTHLWIVREPVREQVFVEGMIEDVTELEKTRDHLLESERRLSTLMGNLPGMAYRCRNDPAWTMEFVSQGCLTLTGYAPEQLIGNRMLSYSDLIHPEDREMVWREVQKDIRYNRQYQIEYRILPFEGGERWVWEQGCLVDDENGGFLEGFIIDISQRKQAEEEIRIINLELEERVRKRTAEVEAANEDLRRFARLASGREIRMAELKQEIRDLRAGLGGSDSSGEWGK